MGLLKTQLQFFSPFLKRTLCTALFLLIGSSNVFAAENSFGQSSVMTVGSSEMDDHSLTIDPSPRTLQLAQNQCRNAVTQAELTQCAAADLQRSQQRLNSLINKISARSGGTNAQALRRIQADWERVAVQHCQWQVQPDLGGSARPMLYYECLNKQYLDRIEALRLNLCEFMTGECQAALQYKDRRRCQ